MKTFQEMINESKLNESKLNESKDVGSAGIPFSSYMDENGITLGKIIKKPGDLKEDNIYCIADDGFGTWTAEWYFKGVDNKGDYVFWCEDEEEQTLILDKNEFKMALKNEAIRNQMRVK